MQNIIFVPFASINHTKFHDTYKQKFKTYQLVFKAKGRVCM